ncbi:MAG: hypothetical protein CMO47_03925 [Verrucomicrobiales bacterium]|nr:hypothetical protein [Verrucomicrobiales bacterium]
MIEYNQLDQGELPVDAELGVKVIGVGGAGANVLDRMALEGSDEAELLTLNTDVRALSTSVSSNKIQLGSTLLKGMGTGGDPSLGKQAALEAVDEIRAAVRDKGIIFICVGLGGGTGSGAAPEVCRIAKEEGVFLVVFATMPFSFEGARRTEQAREALESIGKYANAVIAFDNDRMGELIVPKDGVTQAFAAADKVISQSIRATMNVVFRPGIIRIGMDDLLSALDSKDSRCLFGYGLAKGDNRSHEAVEQALKCPLLDKGRLLNDASAVLVQVAGGDTMTLYEVQLVMEEVNKHVGDGTQILFGTGTDKRLGNSLSVTIISSINGPEGSQATGSDPDTEDEASISLGGSPASSPFTAEEDEVVFEEEADDGVAESLLPTLDQSVEKEQAVFVEDASEEGGSVFEVESADDDGEDHEDEVENSDGSDLEISSEDTADETAEDTTGDTAEDGEEFPSLAGLGITEEVDKEDERNPIARAVEDAGDDLTPFDSVSGPDDDGGVDRVEAVTDAEQKITLTRMASDSDDGRSKSRLPEDFGSNALDSEVRFDDATGDDLPEEGETSEEAKQQQEMLQLEPISGKGRFAKTDPTIVDGEDLDVPTFLRKK